MLAPESLQYADPRRICVIKPSALGDIVQTLPLLPVLQRCYPQAEITWVIKRELADLLDGHPCLAQVIPYDRHRPWRGIWRLLRTLRRQRFDMVLDLQGLLRTAVMTAASGAPIRVGLQTAREGSHWACNCILPRTGREVPAHERYWRLAECLGQGNAVQETYVAVEPADEQWARSQIPRGSGPVIAIHAGAQWETKCWPAEKFAQIARRAAEQLQARIVLVGGSRERLRTRPLVDAVADQSQMVDLVGRTSLKRLAAALRLADLMISNDSGPMHLAAGLGVPVVGIFTCTRPDRSGPPGPQHALVSTQVACAGSYHKRCPLRGEAHLGCHRELDVERVWEAVVRKGGGRRTESGGRGTDGERREKDEDYVWTEI